jgi:hypothetical protein
MNKLKTLHNNSFTETLTMGPLSAFGVPNKTAQEGRKDNDYQQEVPARLRHSNFLPFELTDNNPKSQESQGNPHSQKEICGNKRFPNDYTNNEDGETQFAAIRAERGRQAESARFHNERSVPKQLDRIKMNLNTYYAERSYASFGGRK